MTLRTLVAVVFALAFVPAASAKECTTGVTELCDAVNDAGLNRLFGEWADIASLVLGLFLVVFLIVSLVWLFKRAGAGPRIVVALRDQLRETTPGGKVQLQAEVENRRKRTGTDVAVSWDLLPAGWTATAFASIQLASGFSAPVAIGPDQPLRLSSASKGANKATIALQVQAPFDATDRDTFEVRLRLTPRIRGRPRGRRARSLEYTVFVTSGKPVLQIKTVEHQPAKIETGHPVRTRAVLTNGGEAEAREVGVSFLVNDTPVDRKVVPFVGAHADADVEFEWVPAAGENRIRIAIA